MSKRLISFDTETTGLDFNAGDRVVEIGAVEIIGRNKTGELYQTYLNPDGKEMSEGAAEITNISNEQLKEAPKFKEVADEFIKFITGAELVIHNAEFDLAHLNNELELLGKSKIQNQIIDTLVLAREKFPGSQASLDALCKRYRIDNSKRITHTALIDCDLLAKVYINLIDQKEPSFDLLDKNEFFDIKNSPINKKNISYSIFQMTF